MSGYFLFSLISNVRLRNCGIFINSDSMHALLQRLVGLASTYSFSHGISCRLQLPNRHCCITTDGVHDQGLPCFFIRL